MRELQDWQIRVIEEHEELLGKINRLTNFFGTGAYATMTIPEAALLRRQLGHMQAYLDVLSARIDVFLGRD